MHKQYTSPGPLGKKRIKEKYKELPSDLIEWLALSKVPDADGSYFPELSDASRNRLEQRLINEGYRLSTPHLIALEHSARLCGAPEYGYAIQTLKNALSEQRVRYRKFQEPAETKK
jgi:hypothetical protein